MAAGLGSRFGGTKQLVDVGPNGEAFFDFAIRDALAAGADDVVIIVRSEIEADVKAHVANQHGADAPIAFVCQDHHGPSRPKPWGTGHAILSAAEAITGPFFVVNADDHYGAVSYQLGIKALDAAAENESVVVAFRLANTLPTVGAVSRGVCASDDASMLASIVETHGIERAADGIIRSLDPAGELGDDTLVSMNMWGFPNWLLDHLANGFEAFLAEHGDEEKSEFLLPDVVADLMASGDLAVHVVETDAQWIGVTNPDDLEPAREALRNA